MWRLAQGERFAKGEMCQFGIERTTRASDEGEDVN